MKKLLLLIPLLMLVLAGCSLNPTPQERIENAKADFETHMIDIESDKMSIEKCNSVGFGHYRAANGEIYCSDEKLIN